MKKAKQILAAFVATAMVLALFMAVPSVTQTANAALSDDLAAEIEARKAADDELDEKVAKSFETAISIAKELVAELKTTVEGLIKELKDEIEKKIKEIQDAIAELKEKGQTQEEAITDLKSSVSSQTAQDSTQDSDIADLKSTVSSQSAQITTLLETVASQQEQINALIAAASQTSSADVAAFTNTMAKLSVAAGGSRKVMATCEAIVGADGYEIFAKDATLLGTVEKTATSESTSLQIPNLHYGHHYTVKVRGYKVVGNQKVYTEWSAAKLVFVFR